MVSSRRKALSSEISLRRCCLLKSGGTRVILATLQNKGRIPGSGFLKVVSPTSLQIGSSLGIHGGGPTRIHHQLFASTATIFPNASRSFVSITSPGECEYRSG